ncbi:TetR/AcrR family transcriptional regulator [Paracoccus litorisediminis]|jgi:AcrR family transcriptional regulator|uniref:TetR family transcriptional regulator n=1 Tax=Paracoccus litorisediminis TaxID=2006130 RepID=A0A844HQY1_9RHOB|nr:TetR/AcrR family transcriptional regulator [Paracoccus litorisediminis]MTH60555.1 TetR family transcriptional regulator [Paracoccus litorisediminis]
MTEIAEKALAVEDSPKRQQILDGARKMFMTKGFDAASMQDVARAAGVSKGTLYVYFDSKEAMFQALVMGECSRLQAVIRQMASGTGAVSDELHAIARQMLQTLLQTEVMRAMRMVIGTGEKFPELARTVYQAGPMRSARTLAEYLTKRVERGDLQIDNCEAASSEFIDLVLSGQQRRGLLMMPPLPDDALEEYITRRVGLFLKGYSA